MLIEEINEQFKKYKSGKQVIERYYSNHYSESLASSVHGAIKRDDTVINESMFKKLIKKCKLTKTILNKIMNYSISTMEIKVLLSNLEHNPYKFAYIDNKPLIEYEKCKIIAEHFKIEKIPQHSEEKAWVNTYVNKKSEKDSFFIPQSTLLNDYKTFFKKGIDRTFLDMFCEKRTFNNKEYLTCKSYIDIEKYISEFVYETIAELFEYDANKLEMFLTDYRDIRLNDQQKQCLHLMLKENFVCVNGYPGVGKSTICDVFVQYLSKYAPYETIHFLAPTGMAVKNIKSKIQVVGNKTNVQFDTIHKFIHSYGKTRSRRSEFVTYIIDECSMIDTYLFYKLLKSIKGSTNEDDSDSDDFDSDDFDYDDEVSYKIILLGDNNQLPPISAGQPFLYLLHEKLKRHIPQYTLNKIERQGDSQLRTIICNMIQNPKKINIKTFDNKSMFFETITENNTKKNTYDRKFIEDLVNKYNLVPSESKFITPSNKHPAGCDALNNQLKMIYNSPDEPGTVKKGVAVKNRYESKLFHEGDIVMLTKNQPHGDVNGDFFKIDSIDDSSHDELRYKFHLKNVDDPNGEIRKYSYNDMLDFFILGYACTVHKVQGSQYDTVVIFIDKSHKYQWQMNTSFNLLFTAISRAKKRCIMVGYESLFYGAACNKNKGNDKKAPLTTIIDEIKKYFRN